MSSNIVPKILNILQKSAGDRISVKDLMKEIHLKPEKKRRTHGRGRSRPGDMVSGGQDPKLILAELELLGLIRQSGNRIYPRDPFSITGRVSMSPQGLVFINARGSDSAARDVFVAPKNSLDALPGDEVLVRLKDRSRDRFEGSVIRIIKRARTLYRIKVVDDPVKGGVIGILLDSPGKIMTFVDTSRIPSDTVKRIKPDHVIVATLSGASKKIMGIFFREAAFVRFEDDTDMDVDFERVLMKHNLDIVYPEDIPLPDPDLAIEPENIRDWNKRKDHRNLFTITIDGADSKDFDDAISLDTKAGKNRWKLYVHIADVSHYVGKNSPLDHEAQDRATSVYLVNRVVPMLPPSISENLCSLIAGVNRLAFTAEMDINTKTGEITKSTFYKSVIRVDRRLTYEIAENLIDMDAAGTSNDPDSRILGQMWELSSLLRRSRMLAGRIDLDIPEPKIKLGNKDDVEEIVYRDRLKSSMLIEELMLSANQSVAKFMSKKNARTLYRVHEPMEEAKVEKLNNFFNIYNIPFELKNSDPQNISKAIEKVRSLGDENVQNIFNLILLRSFMQATYRGEPEGHWGLGFEDYCHFTSPIRRYPDLVVHRVLSAIINREKQPYNIEEIDALGEHTSEQERKAMEAERDMYRLKVIRYIEKSDRKNFRGFLTGFKTDRVFLELEGLPAEGVVTLNHLTKDHELILPDQFSVYVKKLSRPAFLGEEWDLELERVDIEEIRLYFKPTWSDSKKVFDRRKR